MSNYYDIKALRDRMRKCKAGLFDMKIAYRGEDVVFFWYVYGPEEAIAATVPIEHCKPNDRLLEAAMKKAKRAMRKM